MATKESGVKNRMIALAETLLDDNDTIPGVYRPIVKKLMRNYLEKAEQSQIEDMLNRVQKEIIPFVLTGAIPDEKNTD